MAPNQSLDERIEHDHARLPEVPGHEIQSAPARAALAVQKPAPKLVALHSRAVAALAWAAMVAQGAVPVRTPAQASAVRAELRFHCSLDLIHHDVRHDDCRRVRLPQIH